MKNHEKKDVWSNSFLFMMSCRTNQAGSFTEGYVYDKNTNKAVAGASVCIWEGNEKGFLEVTKTDSEGYFSFNEKKENRIRE